MRTAMLTLFAVLGLSACNTVEGVGQDIEAGTDAVEQGGDAVEERAEEATGGGM